MRKRGGEAYQISIPHLVPSRVPGLEQLRRPGVAVACIPLSKIRWAVKHHIGAGPDVARRGLHPFLGLYGANLHSTQIERFPSLDEEASVVRSEAVSQSTCETARQLDILLGNPRSLTLFGMMSSSRQSMYQAPRGIGQSGAAMATMSCYATLP